MTIAAVDPTTSFLLFSARSNDGDANDSTVQGRLASATVVEFARDSDDGVPPPITIDWSVIEYGCSVTVQRGVVPGD